MSKHTATKAQRTPATPARAPRKVRRTLGIADTAWRTAAQFLNSRSRDLALMAIVIGAFVAVFEGSLYSARSFAFTGWSAIAFAIMPDALMVLSAAKMRQTGISAAQHHTAKVSMYYGLIFSLFTNMIAAFLKYAPAAWINGSFLLIGAVAYHGIVVVFLWRAVETLTKTRADRKSKPVQVPAPQAASVPAVPAMPIVVNVPEWIKRNLINAR